MAEPYLEIAVEVVRAVKKKTGGSCLNGLYPFFSTKIDQTTSLKCLQEHQLTIIPTDPIACAIALRPSDILNVTDRPTNAASVDRRLIRSPVLFLPKKPISCFKIEEYRLLLIRNTMFWAKREINTLETLQQLSNTNYMYCEAYSTSTVVPTISFNKLNVN